MSNLAIIGPFAAALATLCAVITALFREEIRKWWNRPILTGQIRLRAPDCHKTQVEMVNSIAQRGDCYHFRIWVQNEGKKRAEKVQVFVSRLHKQHADGRFRDVDSFLPMNLRWSHSSSLEIFADGISPGMGKHCDFGQIIDPTFRLHLKLPTPQEHTSLSTILELALEVQPNTLSHLVPEGRYRFYVKIAAANSPPTEKCWELNLTGKWFPDEPKMFSDGIGIVALKAQ